MSTRARTKPNSESNSKPQPVDRFHIGYRWVQSGDQSIQVPLTEADFLHPQEEDRFLITDHHLDAMIDLRQAIQFANHEQPGVRVFCDHRTDWQTGNVLPMGPDVVVFGDFHAEWDGDVGTLTVEDLAVTKLLVVEITSPSTRHVDLGEKPPLYHRVGVPHLLIVDLCPTGGADPQLLGFRATRKEFVPVKADPEYGIWIPTVEMWFKLEGSKVVSHTRSKERILDNQEAVKRLADESARAEAEKQRAEAEKQRAEAEKQRAEAEKQRADELANELAELKAKLANQPTKKNGHK
jgi:colicin import membrane protein